MAKGRFIVLLLIFVPLSLLARWEDLPFHKDQWSKFTEYLGKFLPNKQGKALVLGMSETLADQGAKMFPWIDICHPKLQASREGDLENEFDCLIAIHSLEREPEREQMLQWMYKTLKHGGKGVIFLSSRECDCFDLYVEMVLNYSPWSQMVPNITNLPFSEYREMIEKQGFFILSEEIEQLSVLHATWMLKYDLEEVICDRWAIPAEIQRDFLEELGRCSQPGLIIMPYEFHILEVEKR